MLKSDVCVTVYLMAGVDKLSGNGTDSSNAICDFGVTVHVFKTSNAFFMVSAL